MESPPDTQLSEAFTNSPDLDLLLSQSMEDMFGKADDEDDDEDENEDGDEDDDDDEDVSGIYIAIISDNYNSLQDELDRRSNHSDDEDIPNPQTPPDIPSSTQASRTSTSTPPAVTVQSSSSKPPAVRPAVPKKGRKQPDPELSRLSRDRERKRREAKAKEAAKAKAAKDRAEKAKAKEKANQRRAHIELVLAQLKSFGLTMGDLICHFFEPANSYDRWGEFWKNEFYFERFMESITTKKNHTPSGRRRAHDWAVNHVKRTVRKEAQAITRKRCLQSRHLPIDEDFFLGFRLQDTEDKLAKFCPVMLDVAAWFSTSRAQERAMEKAKGTKMTPKMHKRKVAVVSLMSLLREYNQYNNRFQQILGGMMYISGLQRQCFSILSRMGIVVTYGSLVRTSPRGKRQSSGREEANSAGEAPTSSRRPRMGLLPELSLSLREKAREVVQEHVTAITYDNIAFSSRVAEQAVGHTDAFETGTCATLYQVPGVSKEDLDLEAYWDHLSSASPLQLDDIALTPEEYRLEETSLVQTVLGILIEHGGEAFSRFKKPFKEDFPHLAPIGANKLHPLPAMNVNESSVDGNIDVYEAIVKELSPGDTPAPTHAKMMLGDQLSMSHLRKALTWRVGNEKPVSSMAEVVQGPGLFHFQMTATTLVLENFWGLPSSEANPASLWAHNTLLGRRKLVLTSLPPYRHALDLVNVSLYGRIFCTLPRVTGHKDIAGYMRALTQSNGSEPKELEAC
ncbi:hypothetical protein FRC12_001484 [Ceratobasidium sp. 428]|nr:hypothetical protein FRC12_001484 [Ceratobasidium sp. 428]